MLSSLAHSGVGDAMFGNRWHILIILFVARTAMGFQFQTIASVAPSLREHLAVGSGEVGTLIGLYMLSGIILAFPGGLLVRRYGDRLLCLAGLLLMLLGGIVLGLSDTYAMALTGRLVSGSGAVLMSLALTKMTTDWFAGREIVTAMSILLTSWPLGIALALVTQPPLAQQFGWSWVMHAAAGLCGVAAGLIGIFYRPPPAVSTDAPSAASDSFALPPRAEAIPVIVAGLIWGLFNLGLIVFFSFVPPLLTEQGTNLPDAAFLTSLALWIMIASVPVGGYLVQRSGRPDAAVMLFSGLAGSALLALYGFPEFALLMCMALGISFGPPAGAIMAMPGRVLRPESRAVGLSQFMVAYYVTTTVGPALAGLLQDRMGPAAPVLLAAVLFIGIVPLVLMFRAMVPEPGQSGRSRPSPTAGTSRQQSSS
jgi:predicted MFS family arabinose efflux permease